MLSNCGKCIQSQCRLVMRGLTINGVPLAWVNCKCASFRHASSMTTLWWWWVMPLVTVVVMTAMSPLPICSVPFVCLIWHVWWHCSSMLRKCLSLLVGFVPLAATWALANSSSHLWWQWGSLRCWQSFFSCGWGGSRFGFQACLTNDGCTCRPQASQWSMHAGYDQWSAQFREYCQ